MKRNDSSTQERNKYDGNKIKEDRKGNAIVERRVNTEKRNRTAEARSVRINCHSFH